MTTGETEYGPWHRTVRQVAANGTAVVTHTEHLDERAAIRRLGEAMCERPDAALEVWLSAALEVRP